MPVRLGVIGCGFIGPQHMESIAELGHTRLEAVADLDEERARSAAEKFGAARHYTDPQDLINDPEIDAVVLALAAGFRPELARAALSAGKHIMLEKPVARNVAEFDEIAAAATDGQLIAGASARYALAPHAATLRDYITSGAIGQIRSVHFRNLVPPGPEPTAPPPAWRVSFPQNGGGILVNWSSYELDYIFAITGWTLRPRHVMAQWWGIPPQFSRYVDPKSDADEHFSAMIQCDSGAIITLERGERVAGFPEQAMQVIGTLGSINVSIFPEDGKRIVARDFSEGSPEPRDIIVWEGAETWRDSRVGIIDDFGRAILENRQPQTGAERCRVIQQVTDAIYQSGKENRPVEVR